MRETKTATADMSPPSVHRVKQELAGEIIGAASDIAVVINADGVVQSVSTNSDATDFGDLSHWKDKPFGDVLAVESRTKLALRLKDLNEPGSTARRRIELNHSDGANWAFPVLYTIHETGHPGDRLLIGRDLRPIALIQKQLIKAQLSTEQDYETFREIESRYRLLLDTVQEPLVVLDCSSCRIAEINPAGARLLGASVQTLTGSNFAQAFVGQQKAEFSETLREAGQAGNGKPVHVETRRDNTALSIFPRLFRTSADVMALCRLRPAEADREDTLELLGKRLTALFYNAPDCFVFTDMHGNIVDANEAFLVLTSAAHGADIKGHSLAEYLARGGIDLKVLLENATRLGRLRNYATKAVSAIGSEYSVTVSATHLRGAREAGFGFIIRDTTPAESATETAGPALDGQALQNVVELVGSAPLKELVSATTDVVEKMCIEAAIQLTNNNRVAAAEMLGLSRQSLYVKLRKFGIIGQDNDAD